MRGRGRSARGRVRTGRAGTVAVIALLSAIGTIVAVTPASAASSSVASLKQLNRELTQAASASNHHSRLPAKAYRRIGKLAKGLEHSFTSPSSGCRAGLVAATHLAGDRHNAKRLRSDVKRARTGVASCTIVPEGVKPNPPGGVQLPLPLTPPNVGGVVLNSSGQPLAGQPITVDVDDPLSLYGKEWTTTTDSTGHFKVPYPINEDESWYSWTATTQFPWYGGTWPRDLATVSASDPTNIVFQSNLSDGAHIEISDETGCSVFWQDPEYPGSNPDTQSITVTLTPVGALIDGTSATARTVTFPHGQLCDGSIPVPPGVWTVSNGVDNLGRALIFSSDGGQSYAHSVEVFNAPQSSPWPTAGVDTQFASPPSS